MKLSRKILSIWKNKENETVTAAFFFMVASFFQKALSFITVPVFTRVMTTDQYGLYSTFLSWSTIVSVFLTLRIGSGAFSNILGKENSKSYKNDMAVSLCSLCFTITTIALVIFLIFHDWIVKFTELPIALLILMFIEIYSMPAIDLWSYEQRFNYKYKLLVAFTIIKSIFNVAIGILLVINAPLNRQAEGRVLSIAILEALSMIGIYLYFARRAKKIFSTLNWVKTLKFQLPLIPHSLSMTLLFTSDRIMIQKIVGLEAAGIYSIAYSAGQIIEIMKNAITDALRPWIYNKINRKEFKTFSSTITLISVFVALLSFAFSAIAPELVYFFGGERYYSAIYVIPPVALSSMFTFLYDVFVVIETYYEKTKNIMIASITASVTNIILNFLLIPRLGFIAAGYTTLLSYILLSVLHYSNIRNIERKILAGNQLFNISSLIFIALIGFFSCIIISFLYNHSVIRYCILGMMVALCIIFRRQIIMIAKTLKSAD